MGHRRSTDINVISINGSSAMRKTILHPLFSLSVAFAMTVASAQQDINFDDLKRQGRPLTKTLVVDGAGRDGQGLLQQFSEVDDARVETRRQFFSSSSSGSNSSSSSSSTGRSSSSSSKSNERQASKTFVCTIYCVSINGPKVQHEVKASSRTEAARYVGNNANQICRADGLSKSSNASFSDSQCREK